MLAELKHILRQQKAANLFELSQRLNVDPGITRHMLEHWIRKGKVKKAENIPGCGSACMKCNPLITEVYIWV